MSRRLRWPRRPWVHARRSRRPLFVLLAACVALATVAVALLGAPPGDDQNTRERLKIRRELRKF